MHFDVRGVHQKLLRSNARSQRLGASKYPLSAAAMVVDPNDFLIVVSDSFVHCDPKRGAMP